MARQVWCEKCRSFEFRQADQSPEPKQFRPSLVEVLGWAIILSAYFMALAWAVSR
jgi:hypothetical protein